jgi:hypothetical protein
MEKKEKKKRKERKIEANTLIQLCSENGKNLFLLN